jgi:hypothetical protein
MLTNLVRPLKQLRHAGGTEAWARFAEWFTLLPHERASRFGLRQANAADLVQGVPLGRVQKWRHFRCDPQQSDRGRGHHLLLNLW